MRSLSISYTAARRVPSVSSIMPMSCRFSGFGGLAALALSGTGSGGGGGGGFQSVAANARTSIERDSFSVASDPERMLNSNDFNAGPSSIGANAHTANPVQSNVEMSHVTLRRSCSVRIESVADDKALHALHTRFRRGFSAARHRRVSCPPGFADWPHAHIDAEGPHIA